MAPIFSQEVAPVSRPPRTGGWEFPVFWAALPLIAALLAGAVIIYLVDRWRKRPASVSPGASDQLAHYRSLYERGELSREEFDRLKALLAPQLRQEMNLNQGVRTEPVPPRPAPPAQDAPPAQNGPPSPRPTS
jgi:hypothetical protein